MLSQSNSLTTGSSGTLVIRSSEKKRKDSSSKTSLSKPKDSGIQITGKQAPKQSFSGKGRRLGDSKEESEKKDAKTDALFNHDALNTIEKFLMNNSEEEKEEEKLDMATGGASEQDSSPFTVPTTVPFDSFSSLFERIAEQTSGELEIEEVTKNIRKNLAVFCDKDPNKTEEEEKAEAKDVKEKAKKNVVKIFDATRDFISKQINKVDTDKMIETKRESKAPSKDMKEILDGIKTYFPNVGPMLLDVGINLGKEIKSLVKNDDKTVTSVAKKKEDEPK